MTPTSKQQKDQEQAATTSDPGIVASQVERAVAAQRQEAQATQREIGRNSNGDFTLYADDVDAIATQHRLTTPEAEQYLQRVVRDGEGSDSVLDNLRGSRVIYRQAYDRVLNAPENALTAEDIRLANAEREREEAAKKAEETRKAAAAVGAPTTDRTQPEAGQWGPLADYREVTVSKEEAAQSAQVPVQVVTDVGLAK